MRPLRLRARNLRTFPDLDLDFDHGVVGILGELLDAPEGADSNGAGKSTILEAIDIALFGRRSLAGYLTRGGDVDELMVELTFEHADSAYRVRRTFSAKGRGKTSVDLEQALVHGDDESVYIWDPLTCASAKETDEKLGQILGLSQRTFRESSYLRQRSRSFASADPADAKALLVEAVLGRDPIWPRLADHAKTRRRDAEQHLDRYRGETAQLTEQTATADAVARSLGEAESAVVTAQEVVSRAEQRHTDLAARYQAAREQEATRTTLEAELATARAELDRLDRLETAAAEAAVATASVREELDTLKTASQTDELEQRERDLVAQLEEHRAAAVAYDQALRDRDRALEQQREIIERADKSAALADQVTEKAAALEQQEQPVCQTCGQHVDGDARARAIAAYRDEIALHRDAAARDRKEAGTIAIPAAPDKHVPPTATLGSSTLPAADVLIDVRAQIDRARGQQTQRARLEERLVQLQRDTAARPVADAIAAARDVVSVKERVLGELEPVDLETITREGSEARAHLDTARTVLTDAVATKARCEERLTTIRAAQQKLADLTAQALALQVQVDRDVLLERAYGRNGIPSLIIENSAIPAIEVEADRILGLLGTGFAVELRTQAENKSGGLRDTLEIVVFDENGDLADFEEGTSGGEQTRVELALKIALAAFLSTSRSADSRLLALDEPSFLDRAGMEALLRVLEDLVDRGVFDTVLLVSHVAELRDALEQTITVVRENGRSRIAGAAVLEAAVA